MFFFAMERQNNFFFSSQDNLQCKSKTKLMFLLCDAKPSKVEGNGAYFLIEHFIFLYLDIGCSDIFFSFCSIPPRDVEILVG